MSRRDLLPAAVATAIGVAGAYGVSTLFDNHDTHTVTVNPQVVQHLREGRDQLIRARDRLIEAQRELNKP